MSVDVYVFIRDNELPSRDAWQRVLDEAKSDLHLEEFSPRTHKGFLPALLHGQHCGFEYSCDPVNVEERHWIPPEIEDRDRTASFIWHGNELDARAGLLAAAALAKFSSGVYYDPQCGDIARGESVFQLIRDQDAAERERRLRMAKRKWGSTTKRRCPECGAPCPEYKKKCAVCDFQVGRV